MASVDLLSQAAANQQIEFVPIDIDNYSFSSPVSSQPGDLLYRCATTPTARVIEQLLLTEKTSTFYSSFSRANAYMDNVVRMGIVHQYHTIPSPKTFFDLPTTHQDLDACVEQLGGYPIIIKAAGGSHGVGIIKVDSASSLYSLTDYLRSLDSNFVLKEFINVTSSARLIVLGDQVIDSIQYQAPEGDFRSNEGKVPNVAAKKFSAEVEEIAVKATKVLGLEFGGVDILSDANGKHYVVEMNFPCFFPRCQMITGVDIAGKMIAYLAEKAKSL